MTSSPFSPAELQRYSRHFLLPEIGMEGQLHLKNASVLIVGAGGLGSPVALYLAAAGVGRIGLVDFDNVDEANLHRQILYGESDIGRPKLEAAKERLQETNPHIQIDLHPVRLDASNTVQIISDYDIVADGTDNFATRYLVNDACVMAGVPNAYATVSRFDGQASVFCAPNGPCYRCLFPEPPPAELVPSCADAGVLGVLPGLLGTIQATEVLKLLLGLGDPLIGRLLLVDALSMQFRTLTVPRNPKCPVCGVHPSITSLETSSITCESTVPSSTSNTVPEISVRDYQILRDSDNPPFLLDVRQPEEQAVSTLGGILIPLGELPLRMGELEGRQNDELLVVHCRTGGRSAQAVQYLRMNGFDNVVNLKGGMKAWMEEIGPAVPADS